jgi:FtsP/CotA-like multicopper oxidase with cupredoxin domain
MTPGSRITVLIEAAGSEQHDVISGQVARRMGVALVTRAPVPVLTTVVRPSRSPISWLGAEEGSGRYGKNR